MSQGWLLETNIIQNGSSPGPILWLSAGSTRSMRTAYSQRCQPCRNPFRGRAPGPWPPPHSTGTMASRRVAGSLRGPHRAGRHRRRRCLRPPTRPGETGRPRSWRDGCLDCRHLPGTPPGVGDAQSRRFRGFGHRAPCPLIEPRPDYRDGATGGYGLLKPRSRAIWRRCRRGLRSCRRRRGPGSTGCGRPGPCSTGTGSRCRARPGRRRFRRSGGASPRR